MKLTKLFIDSLEFDGKRRIFCDNEVKGLAVRVNKSTCSYIVTYRNKHGKQKKLTLARTDQITLNDARIEAKKIISGVIRGEDPEQRKMDDRKELKIGELVEEYIESKRARIKNTSYDMDLRCYRCRIFPLIKDVYISEFKLKDAQKFYDSLLIGKTLINRISEDKDKRYIAFANRALSVLSGAFNYAVATELLLVNPCTKVRRLKNPQRTFYLDEKGLKLFAERMELINTAYPQTKDAIRIIALTGCRKSEIIDLKWKYIDFDNQVFKFPDTKTGAQNRPFGIAAKKYLLKIKDEYKFTKKDDYVFEDRTNLKKRITYYFNRRLQHFEGFEDFMPHSLRHTFVSNASALGLSDSVIASLVGHKLATMTSRYTHLNDEVKRNAADKVSMFIANAMGLKFEDDVQEQSPVQEQNLVLGSTLALSSTLSVNYGNYGCTIARY